MGGCRCVGGGGERLHARVWVNVCVNAWVCRYVRVGVCVCVHACGLMCVCAWVRRYMRVGVCVCVHACGFMCVRALCGQVV